MIKLLLLVLLGFVLYAFFLSLVRPSTLRKPDNGSGRGPENKQISGETMVEDPVCGTFIPVNDAVKGRIQGQDHYFCSKDCLEEFNRQQHNPPPS